MLTPAPDYRSLVQAFRWAIPDRYNIARSACTAWAARDPERLALIMVERDGSVRTWTYQELDRASNRFANVLRAHGIGRGDRVATQLPQTAETVIAHFAVYKLGGIAVPLAALFGVDAVRYRLSDSGAKAFVTNGIGVEKLNGDLSGLSGLERVWSIDGHATLSGAGGEARDFWTDARNASDVFDMADTGPDDPALMIYTSGTTGPPKGALHGHRVVLGHLPGMQMSHDFLPQAGDRLWTPADWAWAGGLLNVVLTGLHLGVPIVGSAQQKFEPDWAFDLMARQGVRNTFLPPTALKILKGIENPRARYTLNLRSVGSGGEALGEAVYHWAQQALGMTINEFYGQTECNLVLSSAVSIGVTRAGAIGKPVPGHQVAVIGGDGAPVTVGTLGQIAVKRPDPVMFLEYWNKPDATRMKFIGDWMTTGDQGLMDKDGYVHFVGRDDDVITSAGYRIGPGEIEDCLLTHPAVALAAVIGKPDPVRTEIVKAFIVLADGYLPSEALVTEIQAHVRERLAAHEYPREIAFIDEMPLTTTGKVIRRALRKDA